MSMAINSTHISYDELCHLQPSKDYVYVACKQDLFKTYQPFASSSTRCFGSYVKSYRDSSYDINCIEGVSPKVYKTKKLLYVGVFEGQSSPYDKLFVFSDCDCHDMRFSGYVLPYHSGFSNYANYALSSDVVYAIGDKHVLDIELMAKSEEDCLKICRELNCEWHNDMRFIGFAEKAPYIKKTLKSMMKQLDDFMKSECMVDPKTQIEKDLNGNED